MPYQTTRDTHTLESIALKLRRDILRMIHRGGSGHPGGSLSVIDILVALFFAEMSYRPAEPDWPERDRFVLSKGHACAALYALFSEIGVYPADEIWTYREMGSPYQGHPDMLMTRGIELPTGSLGQGLSGANGMALAGKLDARGWRVYCVLGDGECQEGEVWEAALTAAHYRLDNVCAIVDHNKVQQTGKVADIKGLAPLAEKWRAFGWQALEVDGHKMSEILSALEEARGTRGRPTAIVAHTVKGKGVSFMEGQSKFHGKAPDDQQLKQALAELDAAAQGTKGGAVNE